MTNLIKNINEAQNFIYSRGDFEEGLKSAQKAYKLRPDNLEAIYIYAIALYFNDDYKKALELFHILDNILFQPLPKKHNNKANDLKDILKSIIYCIKFVTYTTERVFISYKYRFNGDFNVAVIKPTFSNEF